MMRCGGRSRQGVPDATTGDYYFTDENADSLSQQVKAVGNPGSCQGVLSAVTRGGDSLLTAGAPGESRHYSLRNPENIAPPPASCVIYFLRLISTSLHVPFDFPRHTFLFYPEKLSFLL